MLIQCIKWIERQTSAEELATSLKGLDLDADSLDDLYNAFNENNIAVVSEGEDASDGGEKILLDDGKIGLKVIKIENDTVYAEVLFGEILKARKEFAKYEEKANNLYNHLLVRQTYQLNRLLPFHMLHYRNHHFFHYHTYCLSSLLLH